MIGQIRNAVRSQVDFNQWFRVWVLIWGMVCDVTSFTQLSERRVNHSRRTRNFASPSPYCVPFLQTNRDWFGDIGYIFGNESTFEREERRPSLWEFSPDELRVICALDSNVASKGSRMRENTLTERRVNIRSTRNWERIEQAVKNTLA